MNRTEDDIPRAPASLAGPGWDALMLIATEIGEGDPARGLDSVVGIVRQVRTDAALEASMPWVRTIAATQAGGSDDADILFAFRLDGSQLPRLLEMRAAFGSPSSPPLDPPLDPEEVLEAEWLLRVMGIPSRLTDLSLRHLRGFNRSSHAVPDLGAAGADGTVTASGGSAAIHSPAQGNGAGSPRMNKAA